MWLLLAEPVFAWTNPSLNPASGGGSVIAEQNSPSSVIYIKSNGNVGIGGVTNPGSKLQINAISDTAGDGLRVGSAAIGYGAIRTATTGSGAMVFDTYSGSAWNAGVMVLTTGGNVGIGKIPTTELDVNGTVKATGFEGPLTGTISAPNVSAGAFGANTGGGNYSFPGNVGVGTTTPVSPAGFTRVLDISAVDTSLAFHPSSVSGAGIEVAGAYPLRVYTNGSERMRIDSSGNVGIGTASPQGLLHVHTATADGPATLYLTNGGQAIPPSDLGALWFGSTEGLGYTASGIKGLAEADFNTTDWPSALTFWTTADNSGVPTEAMRITRDRNVGIGTTSPAQKLSVAGVIESTTGGFKFPDGTTQTTAGGGGGTITAANVSSGNFGESTGGGNYSFPANMGIGTTTPTSPAGVARFLQISSPTHAGIVLTDTGASSSWDMWNNGGSLYTYTGATYGWTVNASGQLGIGTITPTRQIEISSNDNSLGGTLRLTNPRATIVAEDVIGTIEFWNNDADTPKIGSYIKSLARETYGRTGALAFGVSTTINTNAVEVMRINEAGNVGIGTASPAAADWTSAAKVLEIDGSTYGVITLQGGATRYQTGVGNGYYYMAYDDVTNEHRIVVNSTGNVGIGVTNASTKLEVNGTVKATGSLIVNSGVGNKIIATNVPIIEGGAAGVTRVFRNLANFEGGSGTLGAIVVNTGITSPVSAMSVVHIRGYEYGSTVGPGNVVDIDVASYFNGPTWSNRSYVNHGSVIPSAVSIGTSPSGTIVIVIGSITDNWSYPKLWVESWIQSHSSTADSAADNWSMSAVTDLTGYTLASVGHEGLSIQGGNIVGDLNVSGNSNICHLVAYSGGTTACPAGYYTWTGQALASGYMLCCKVDNPI